MVHAPTILETILDYNFKKVACGSAHTILLEENGNLLAFGDNRSGQIGYSVSVGAVQRTPIAVFQNRA